MSYMGRLEGRIKVPAGGWDTTVGGATATIAEGTYYPSSADSASDDFLGALATTWAAAASTSCSITINASENGTGIVTITFGSAKAIAWVDTEIRDLLGFSGDSAAATSHVGTLSARALWLPSCHYKAPDVPSDEFKGIPFTDARVVTNQAGYAWHVAGQMHYQLPIEWPAVTAAKTRISQESTSHTSFERFWRDNIFGAAAWAKPGGPVRLYPNAADDATYVEYRVLEPLSSFEPQPLLEGLPTGPHRVAMRLIAVGDDPIETALPTMPNYQATGTPLSSAGGFTLAWPTHQAGDVALAVLTTLNAQPAVITTANGFAAVADTPISAADNETAVYWCRATSSSQAGLVVGDSGNFQFGVIFTFRNVIDTGNPWDVTAASIAASGTAVSIPGDTTTTANCLVVAICVGGLDVLGGAQFSGWANASLTSVTEQIDISTDTGSGGIIGVATGEKASAGAYGATTATLASASAQALLSIALKGR